MNIRNVGFISFIVFLLLFVDAYSIYVFENLDLTILGFVKMYWSETTNQIITFITNLSGETAVVSFTLVVLLLLIIFKKIDLFAFTAMSLIGSIILFSMFKVIVGRIRPLTKLYDPGAYSFPSGHAAMSMCMCLIIYFLIKQFINIQRQKLLLFLCLLFPLTISFTRVFLHVHYFSDVIAGMALALAWVSYMSYIYLPNESSKTRQV